MITKSDEDLIEGCIVSDKRMQEELYTRYASRMWGVCLRYARNRDEAEDILQEGFIKVFNNIGKFRNEGSFEGWIRRIMVNTALKQYSRDTFREESLGDDEYLAGSIPAEAISRLSEKDLLMLIAELPEGYRLVFNLYVIEGYDHKEIASMLGIAESTSRSQLMKARAMLQKKLAPQQDHRKSIIFILMAADQNNVDELIREKLVNYSPEAPSHMWSKISSRQDFYSRLSSLLHTKGITMAIIGGTLMMATALCGFFLHGDNAYGQDNNKVMSAVSTGNSSTEAVVNADATGSNIQDKSAAGPGEIASQNNNDKVKNVDDSKVQRNNKSKQTGNKNRKITANAGSKSSNTLKSDQNFDGYSLNTRKRTGKNPVVAAVNNTFLQYGFTTGKKLSTKSSISISPSMIVSKNEADHANEAGEYSPLHTSSFDDHLYDIVTPPLPGTTVDDAFALAAEPITFRLPRWYDRLSVRLVGSPFIIDRTVSANSPMFTSYGETVSASEKLKPGFTGGLNFEYELGENLSLRTGVMYTQYKSDFQFTTHAHFESSYDSVTTTYIIDPFNPPVVVYHHNNIIKTEDKYDTVTYVNTYSSINAPLLIKYNYTYRKLGLHAAIGPVMNISLKPKGIMLNDSILVEDSGNDHSLRKASMSFYAGIGCEYSLTPHIGVSIEPYANYSAGSVTKKNAPLRQEMRSYGVLTGITYKF